MAPLERVLLVAPFVVQADAMLVDELHFHRQRGLPRWERLGHPLDTLTVIVCLGWLIAAGRGAGHEASLVYFGLCAFSCLFVTKDELVHSRLCGPAEQWLHAVLFVLHPLCLIAAWRLWRSGEGALFLKAQLTALVAVLAYQALYWNVSWNRKASLPR